jgi:hypothetical protein
MIKNLKEIINRNDEYEKLFDAWWFSLSFIVAKSELVFFLLFKWAIRLFFVSIFFRNHEKSSL